MPCGFWSLTPYERTRQNCDFTTSFGAAEPTRFDAFGSSHWSPTLVRISQSAEATSLARREPGRLASHGSSSMK